MIFLPPLIFTAILGFIFSQAVTKCSSISHRKFFLATLSLPFGIGLCSLIIFWAYVLDARDGKALTIVLAYILAGALLLVYFSSGSSSKAEKQQNTDAVHGFFKFGFSIFSIPKFIINFAMLALLGYAIYQLFALFSSSVVWNAAGGWDTKFFWHVKAKFYFRDPASWANMFSPLMSWTHGDYPLMLPGAVAFGWNWLGKEFIIWPHVVSIVYTLATPLLITWYVATYWSRWMGLLAGSFLLMMSAYTYWSVELYADIHLCFFITAAGAFLIYALKNKDRNFFFLAGFMAGMAAWTKNEGSFFCLWCFLLAAVNLVFERQLTVREKTRLGLYFLAGVMIPVSNFLCQKFIYSPKGDYWGAGITLSDCFKMLFSSPEKTSVICTGYISYMFQPFHWNGLWFFFVAAIAYRILFLFRTNQSGYGWNFAVLILLMHAGYFAIMHLSTYEIHFQVETALTRLLLHSSGLAILFIFDSLGEGSRDLLLQISNLKFLKKPD